MDVKTNIISIVSALFALVICGLIYLRIIKREVPEPIGKLQAILPVILGGICVLVSGPAGIGLLYAFKNIGVTGETMATLPASFFTAFFVAGGVEELFKFLAIIITIAILKNKVKNVYEYIILGGVAVLTNVILLIYVLVRARKNAEKFSALSILPKDAQ